MMTPIGSSGEKCTLDCDAFRAVLSYLFCSGVQGCTCDSSVDRKNDDRGKVSLKGYLCLGVVDCCRKRKLFCMGNVLLMEINSMRTVKKIFGKSCSRKLIFWIRVIRLSRRIIEQVD